MSVNTYDYVAFYSSVAMCSLMTIYALYAFIYVMVKSKFKWVQFMLFLCIIQNLNSTVLAIAVYTEITPFHQAH